MSKKINELGNKYDTMIVIREVRKDEKTDKKGSVYWELQADVNTSAFFNLK